MRVAVIGAGSWGTALALVLAEAGHEVVLWARTPEVARAINEEHRNPRYLSDYRLPSAIRATADYACACEGAEAVVIVTPSAALRSVAADLRELIAPGTPIVICSKGVEEKTGLLPIDTFAAELGNAGRMAVLSGPTHAEEVGRHLPSAIVAASKEQQAAELVQQLFMNARFRVYTSSDVVGAELGAALKNVIALCAGISDGMGFGDNTRAMLMTRGLTEIARLGVALGGRKDTFTGLAGVGDLIVTCTSMHSRNRRAGILIGQGKTPEQAMAEVGAVVEGYYAARAGPPAGRPLERELPITAAAYRVLYEGADVSQTVTQLLCREKRAETEDASWDSHGNCS